MSIRDDLNFGLKAFGVQIPERFSIDEWAATLPNKPTQNTITMVTGAAVLFYIAERGRNPKVRDIYDALIYCTTNISVGFSDIFAQTPMGKLIGSALMTLGPAMAARTLDGPRDANPPASAPDATQEQILATLQQILSQLQKQENAACNTSPSPDAAGDGPHEDPV